ncbi:MAG: CRTAC1 family protein [Rhizobiales bacterium]|nr:CRTAC1 family protein [Hyphomicrobiales bacterium]MBI3673463.1 CRTAC1 family protein [Hyphomicrobiales bacterium]
MKKLLAVVLFAAPALADDAPLAPTNDIPAMVEEHAAAGVNHVYGGPWEFFVGGGGAAFDCNGDRKPDLLLAGGKNPAELYVNESAIGGALKFRAIPLDIGKYAENVTGAYPLDIDGDGRVDVALLRVGQNVLLKGGPDCTFSVANSDWKFDGGDEWTTAFSAEWEAGQNFPTLAFGNYVDRKAPGSPWGTCHDNFLIRPDGGERPSYSQPITLAPGYCALSMLFTDWNKSGEASLRITNDRQYYRGGEEQLWKVPPGKAPAAYGKADGWRRVVIWGMGIAQGDLDGSGVPSYALTSMGDTKLQKLDEEADAGSPVYRDIAFERGATAYRPYTGGDLKPSTGWHSEFADFNNDGLLDLFIAKGNVEAMGDFAKNDPDNLLLGQWDGRFAEAGKEAGIALATKGRGALVADFNMDGNLDLVVINRSQPTSVFRSTGGEVQGGGTRPMGNFLEIELKEPGGNRMAVGAMINVKIGTRTMNRWVSVGGGHASGHIGWTHFGLGNSERAEIRVKWPDGEWSHPYRVFANQFVIVDREKPIASYWYPE